MIRLLNVYGPRSSFLRIPGVAGARIQSNTMIWFYATGSWEAQSGPSDLRGSSGRGDWEIREHHHAVWPRYLTNGVRRNVPGVRLVNCRPYRGYCGGGPARSARRAEAGDRRRRRCKKSPPPVGALVDHDHVTDLG